MQDLRNKELWMLDGNPPIILERWRCMSAWLGHITRNWQSRFHFGFPDFQQPFSWHMRLPSHCLSLPLLWPSNCWKLRPCKYHFFWEAHFNSPRQMVCSCADPHVFPLLQYLHEIQSECQACASTNTQATCPGGAPWFAPLYPTRHAVPGAESGN